MLLDRILCEQGSGDRLIFRIGSGLGVSILEWLAARTYSQLIMLIAKHPGEHYCGFLVVEAFKCGGIDRLSVIEPDTAGPGKFFCSGPGFKRPFDGHEDDRGVGFTGQAYYSRLQVGYLSGFGSGSLGEQDQCTAGFEYAKRLLEGAYIGRPSLDRKRVDLRENRFQQGYFKQCVTSHEAEDSAGSGTDQRRIQKALVVGGEDCRSFVGDVLDVGDSNAQEQGSSDIDQEASEPVSVHM